MQLSMPLRRPLSHRSLRSAMARRLKRTQPAVVRALLVGLVLMAQGITLATVLNRSSSVNRRVAQMHASTALISNADAIRRQVRLLTEPAQLAVLAFAESARRGLIASGDEQQIASYMLAQLKASTDISLLNFGTTDGALIMASRFDDHFEIRRVRPVNSAGDAMTTGTEYPFDGRPVTHQPVTLVPFDARTRPWYLAAIDQDKGVWSRSMQYTRLERIGVQFSRRVVDGTGRVHGVISAMVDSQILDRSIERAGIPHFTSASLATRDGAIIGASPGVIRPHSGARAIPSVDDITHPELRSLLSHARPSVDHAVAADSPVQPIGADPDPDLGLVATLRAGGDDPPWIMALSAPVAAIERDLKRTELGGGLGGLAVPLLLPLLGIAAMVWTMRPFLRVHRLATTDALTGLLNRNFFLDRLDTMLARLGRSRFREQRDILLIALDLDGFKAVNDAHGHGSGDCILATLGHRLTRSVRTGDLVARMGGDEFVVAMQVDRHDDMGALAQRLLAKITAEPVQDRTLRFPLHATAGYAVAQTSEAAETLVRRADLALIRGKAMARGLVYPAG